MASWFKQGMNLSKRKYSFVNSSCQDIDKICGDGIFDNIVIDYMEATFKPFQQS